MKCSLFFMNSSVFSLIYSYEYLSIYLLTIKTVAIYIYISSLGPQSFLYSRCCSVCCYFNDVYECESIAISRWRRLRRFIFCCFWNDDGLLLLLFLLWFRRLSVIIRERNFASRKVHWTLIWRNRHNGECINMMTMWREISWRERSSQFRVLLFLR